MALPPPPPPLPPPTWGPVGPAAAVPAPTPLVWLARTLDWALVVAWWLLGMGLAAVSGVDRPVLIGAGILGGILGAAVLVLVEAWWLRARGLSLALLLLGLRAPHVEDFFDGVDWFAGFWTDLLLLPFARLWRRGREPAAVVRDPRLRTPSMRGLRLVATLAVLATPVPAALALA